MFADDNLIFYNATTTESQNLQEILATYEHMFG